MNVARPGKLYSQLRAIHLRTQLLNLLLGILAFSTWLILLFLACFATDWVIRFPVVVRSLLLPILLGLAAYKAWRAGWRWFRSFSATDSALRAETQHSGLHSLLVTGIQLHGGHLAGGTSESMAAFTVRKADEAAAQVMPGKVIPFTGLKRPAAITSLLGIVLIAIALVNANLLFAGLARVFAPWRGDMYPTRTTIEQISGDLIVREGDPVTLRADLGGEVPLTAQLALRTGAGKSRKLPLKVVDRQCEYKIGSAFRSFDYSVRAGDAVTEWHTVQVISSPRIVDTAIRITYPEYIERQPEILEAMTLTVPEGVSIEWNLHLDRPLRGALFSLEGREPMPLEISADGLVVTHRMVASASGAYAFSWVDKANGFAFDTPKSYLQVMPDRPPQVELVSPSKNLFATLGRKLELKYRAVDDHGIGTGAVLYRRDNAAEKRVDFRPTASKGRDVETVDWDYRDAIENLQIGESVMFAIEVADRYPPPGGPHRVRSESRRVSFLSREEYLEKIDEQRSRLLSQLRGIYRQQRAAYDVIRHLDPTDEAFEQTCFLESSRQDILVERVALMRDGMKDLVDDLAANNITDESEFAALRSMRERLTTLSEGRMSLAAARLRDLAPAAKRGKGEVAETVKIINDAARELGALVLRLGVVEALEVFATELHVIAQSQNALRLEIMDAGVDSARMAARQRQLAAWIAGLLTELDENRTYSGPALATVRMARMIKDLRAAGIAGSMGEAADRLERGQRHEAMAVQGKVVQDIFALECNIRVGSEYEALLDARRLFTEMSKDLGFAVDAGEGGDKEERVNDLNAAQRSLLLLILPSIPAPERKFLAAEPVAVPPVGKLVARLQKSLREAVELLEAGEREAASGEIQAAVQVLQQLSGIVEVRLDEITRVARYAGHAGAAMERSELVRELWADQMRLTEKTEDADYDQTPAAYLAPSQRHLSDKVGKMHDRLARKNTGRSASLTVGPMLKMLTRAAAAMIDAAPALAAEKLGEAIGQQDRVLDALQAAMTFANHESNGWMGLANLIMTAEGMAVPARYMRDIVAEQRDLIAATGASTPESRAQLIEIQKNLALAVLDVSMLVEGTGSGLDFEQAMIFAGSDMGTSVLKLETGDINGAVQAQRMATESVADLSRQFDDYEKQFYYFVTAMEFLQEMHTEGVLLQDALGGLHDNLTNPSETDESSGPEKEVSLVLQDAARFSSGMLSASGRPDYARAHAAVEAAFKAIEKGDKDACLNALTSAGTMLEESMGELRELMAKVAYIPSIEPIEAPPEYDVMLEMVSLLLEQRRVARAVHEAGENEWDTLVPATGELVATATDLAETTGGHKFMVAAREKMSEAVTYLENSSSKEASRALLEAEKMLRQTILEYALYYVEIEKPRGGRRRKKGKSSIVTMFKMSNKIKPSFDKNWGGVEGEDPEAGRSEWEVLGRRNRAALNENFVRELPLEYREFLKDYYERLAR